MGNLKLLEKKKLRRTTKKMLRVF